MAARRILDLACFESLKGSDLVEYVEPILADSTAVISSESLDVILKHMGSYDEYHLVYALEIGVLHEPRRFSLMLASYLTHDAQCVRLAASRCLQRLPNGYVTRRLLMEVKDAALQCPEKMEDLVAALEHKVRA